ncbi:MAG: M3 family metallopeptidase, partial [Cyclobacteriaceae bacterium]
MKELIFLLTVSILLSSCNNSKENTMANGNPFYQEYDTPYGVPPFEQIKDEHYMQAFEDGMAQQMEEVEAIANNTEAPTFENTIEAFEKTGPLLNKVSKVFSNLSSAHTNDSIKGLSRVVSPLLSSHRDNIFLNEKFYQRVKKLNDQKEELNLTVEQGKLLGNYYRGFVRAGAGLNAEEKSKMRELNGKMSSLAVKFGENVLEETNSFELLVEDENELAGLSENLKNAAADAATNRGYVEKYLFTPHKPSLIPFITYSSNRDLRMKLKKAYINQGNNDNEYDNKEIARELANLRLQKANLLGYETWSHYVLGERMLDSPDKVFNLLDKVWPAALERAKQERDMMAKMAKEEGQDIEIGPWDWWYYAEKIKMKEYNLDEEEIRPYLKVDNVINGTFILANKLFGMTFEEREGIPKYH